MINKELLESARRKRIYWFRKDFPNSSAPKPMFVGGNFNPDNWNGGDAGLIRAYFKDIETSNDWRRRYELDECDLIVTYTWSEDQNYIAIIEKQYGYKTNYNTYIFSWYKDRGKTEYASCNGHLITEDEYIRLLNLIEQADYAFKLQ